MISEDFPEILWKKSLNKSLINNRQLEFHDFFYLSYLNISEPEIDYFRFRDFVDHQGNSLIISTLDKRGKNFQILKDNLKNMLEMCWFFPLSREKFRIKVRISFLSQDFYLNHTKYQLELKKQEEIKKCIWDKLSKDEKKEFHNKLPDTLTPEKEVLPDIDRFNSPDKTDISENLAIVLLEPIEIEHSIFPMPQVAADARHSKFESLFQPYKVQKKYRHIFNEEKKVWDTFTLNP